MWRADRRSQASSATCEEGLRDSRRANRPRFADGTAKVRRPSISVTNPDLGRGSAVGRGFSSVGVILSELEERFIVVVDGPLLKLRYTSSRTIRSQSSSPGLRHEPAPRPRLDRLPLLGCDGRHAYFLPHDCSRRPRPRQGGRRRSPFLSLRRVLKKRWAGRVTSVTGTRSPRAGRRSRSRAGSDSETACGMAPSLGRIVPRPDPAGEAETVSRVQRPAQDVAAVEAADAPSTSPVRPSPWSPSRDPRTGRAPTPRSDATSPSDPSPPRNTTARAHIRRGWRSRFPRKESGPPPDFGRLDWVPRPGIGVRPRLIPR